MGTRRPGGLMYEFEMQCRRTVVAASQQNLKKSVQKMMLMVCEMFWPEWKLGGV